jgi:hypothetical protein
MGDKKYDGAKGTYHRKTPNFRVGSAQRESQAGILNERKTTSISPIFPAPFVAAYDFIATEGYPRTTLVPGLHTNN